MLVPSLSWQATVEVSQLSERLAAAERVQVRGVGGGVGGGGGTNEGCGGVQARQWWCHSRVYEEVTSSK